MRTLANYISYVKERVPDVVSAEVKLCDGGEVDVGYTARHKKFERIRGITGKEIVVRRQAA